MIEVTKKCEVKFSLLINQKLLLTRVIDLRVTNGYN